MDRSTIESLSQELVQQLRESRRAKEDGHPSADQAIREIEERLIRINQRLVERYARHFSVGCSIPIDDCLSEAYLGLLRAVRVASGRRCPDCTFEAIANTRVRCALLDLIRKTRRRQARFAIYGNFDLFPALDESAETRESLDAAEEIAARMSDLDGQLIQLIRSGHTLRVSAKSLDLRLTSAWERWDRIRREVRRSLPSAVHA